MRDCNPTHDSVIEAAGVTMRSIPPWRKFASILCLHNEYERKLNLVYRAVYTCLFVSRHHPIPKGHISMAVLHCSSRQCSSFLGRRVQAHNGSNLGSVNCRRPSQRRGHRCRANRSSRLDVQAVSVRCIPRSLYPQTTPLLLVHFNRYTWERERAQVIPQLQGDATEQTPPDLPSFLFKERIVYLVRTFKRQ